MSIDDLNKSENAISQDELKHILGGANPIQGGSANLGDPTTKDCIISCDTCSGSCKDGCINGCKDCQKDGK